MHVLTLYAPQRDRGAAGHSAFVDRVGEGLCEFVAVPTKPGLTSLIEIENVKCTTSMEAALKHVYGDNFQHMTDDKRAIITTHNSSVEELNAIMLGKLRTPLRTMYSEDRLEEERDYKRGSFSHADFFNKLKTNPASTPPRDLQLKVGAMAMLMRIFSKKDKLINCTRIVVVAISTYSIIVRACCDNALHALSRIMFKLQCKRSNTNVLRRQFPIRLAYAMTVHKCQGQTLDRVALDMRQQPFSHGILYVACGRVRNESSLLALVDSNTMTAGEGSEARALVTNMARQELLPSAWRATAQRAVGQDAAEHEPQPRTQEEANAAHDDGQCSSDDGLDVD